MAAVSGAGALCLSSSVGGANTLSGLGDLEPGCLAGCHLPVLRASSSGPGFGWGYLSLIGFIGFVLCGRLGAGVNVKADHLERGVPLPPGRQRVRG